MTKVYFHRSDVDGNKYTVEGISRLAFALKASMKLRGWSERKLAGAAGISHVTVNKYARGNIHEPQSEILKALSPFIFRVVSIDLENIEIYADETYGEDWQALEKIATSEYFEVSQFKVAETPTRYRSHPTKE